MVPPRKYYQEEASPTESIPISARSKLLVVPPRKYYPQYLCDLAKLVGSAPGGTLHIWGTGTRLHTRKQNDWPSRGSSQAHPDEWSNVTDDNSPTTRKRASISNAVVHASATELSICVSNTLLHIPNIFYRQL